MVHSGNSPAPRRGQAFLAACYCCLALFASALNREARADDKVSSSTVSAIDYAREIRPILARKCYACHGPDAAEGGLALHLGEAAIQPLESGENAIVPGKPEQSHLLARVRTANLDERMPPPEQEALTDREIGLLEEWIRQGAEFSRHWAFEPVPVVAVPEAIAPGASDNPIDRFIEASLHKQKLTPSPPADRRTLIRRVTFDLTGLPPSPQEVADFVNDPAHDAYEQLVERLLASPHYGERWARHWLDVVRYAETNSFERDGGKPNAWKYRDYVIQSFNADKPYDQFLREQLAGDEFPEPNRESILATGFYRLGIWDDEPADPLLARYDELDSILTTIGQGILGLTLNCSRCHDHKVDPLPQSDYYRLLAFLQGLTPYARRGDERTNSQTDVSPPGVVALYAENEAQLSDLRTRMFELEQQGVVKMSAEDQRKSETGERKKLLEAKLRDYLEEDQRIQYEKFLQRERELEAARKQFPPRETVLSIARENPRPEPTHILLRGNPNVPGEAVQPGFPGLFQSETPELPLPGNHATTAGRRSVLADWITSPENRLTARVMANRIWQHHFGRGIVRTPNNFGLLGTPPTHPELLNWLAGRFIAEGWRMKPLHRLIVTSQAYRRSSVSVADSLSRDPGNDFFWRFDPRRLGAEELRDAILLASGSLNRKMFGPSMYPELSREVLATQSQPGQGWGKSSPEEQNRRSIYIYIKRSLIPPELAGFDFPETDVTCEARFVTIQPAQSLNMLNGAFLNRQAAQLARRLGEAETDLPQRVERGWQLTLAREPTSEERARSLKLIADLQTKHHLDDADALKYFCLYLLNLNEFVFLD
ncbi:MAG: DUF1553 domain-containing protein [Planctomycetaceae bacterium]|nr:DUF1553 domain-containing protein [Planctomycetaceae bacterium]